MFAAGVLLASVPVFVPELKAMLLRVKASSEKTKKKRA